MKKPHSFVRLSGFVLFVALIAVIAFGRIPFLPSQPQWIEDLDVSLGLDLRGGLHLEYALDLSRVEPGAEQDAVDAVQAVVERRVNAFGVGEPLIQIAQHGLERYLIVEIPGISDIEEAKNVITKTPFLEFREERSEEEVEAYFAPLNTTFREEADATLARIVAGASFESVQEEIHPTPEESADDAAAGEGADADATTEEVEGESEEEQNFVTKGSLVGAPDIERVLFDEDLASGEVYPEIVESDLGYHIVQKGEVRTVPGEGEGAAPEQQVAMELITFVKRSIRTDGPSVLYKPTELTGEYLKGAQVTYPQIGGVSSPEVSIQFNTEGARLFEELTARSVGKTIAIAVDDEIVSAPVVQETLYGGTAQITGRFSAEEAKNLAGRLNEGALPVPITLVSQQSIEASLGQKALDVSLIAGGWGLALVMLYMVIYYRFYGLIAASAIGIYAMMMVAILKLSSLFPSNLAITLTLSGIAGIILSIGMAVDANILIFERIKEELRRGRRLSQAIHEGFARAWSAIYDGNISTILTSLILVIIGTGFVKGFALILMIGVLLSMFTAIVLVRFMIDALSGHWLEKRPWLICRRRADERNSSTKNS